MMIRAIVLLAFFAAGFYTGALFEHRTCEAVSYHTLVRC